jgi:hypothetical protein
VAIAKYRRRSIRGSWRRRGRYRLQGRGSLRKQEVGSPSRVRRCRCRRAPFTHRLRHRLLHRRLRHRGLHRRCPAGSWPAHTVSGNARGVPSRHIGAGPAGSLRRQYVAVSGRSWSPHFGSRVPVGFNVLDEVCGPLFEPARRRRRRPWKEQSTTAARVWSCRSGTATASKRPDWVRKRSQAAAHARNGSDECFGSTRRAWRGAA